MLDSFSANKYAVKNYFKCPKQMSFSICFISFEPDFKTFSAALCGYNILLYSSLTYLVLIGQSCILWLNKRVIGPYNWMHLK